MVAVPAAQPVPARRSPWEDAWISPERCLPALRDRQRADLHLAHPARGTVTALADVAVGLSLNVGSSISRRARCWSAMDEARLAPSPTAASRPPARARRLLRRGRRRRRRGGGSNFCSGFQLRWERRIGGPGRPERRTGHDPGAQWCDLIDRRCWCARRRDTHPLAKPWRCRWRRRRGGKGGRGGSLGAGTTPPRAAGSASSTAGRAGRWRRRQRQLRRCPGGGGGGGGGAILFKGNASASLRLDGLVSLQGGSGECCAPDNASPGGAGAGGSFFIDASAGTVTAPAPSRCAADAGGSGSTGGSCGGGGGGGGGALQIPRRWRNPARHLRRRWGGRRSCGGGGHAAKRRFRRAQATLSGPFTAPDSRVTTGEQAGACPPEGSCQVAAGGLSRPPFADGSDAPYPPIAVVVDLVSLGYHAALRRRLRRNPRRGAWARARNRGVRQPVAVFRTQSGPDEGQVKFLSVALVAPLLDAVEAVLSSLDSSGDPSKPGTPNHGRAERARDVVHRVRVAIPKSGTGGAAGQVNYLVGSNARTWRTNIATTPGSPIAICIPASI